MKVNQNIPDTLTEATKAYHALIDEIFLLHQEAVLDKRDVLAGELLQFFRQQLERHMALEDDLIFVAHRALGTAVRWPTSLYAHEHAKVRDLLEQTETRFRDVLVAPTRRARLELLDFQRTFKNVLEHHEEREEKALLPELSEAGECPNLLAAIETHWPPLALLQQQISIFRRQLEE